MSQRLTDTDEFSIINREFVFHITRQEFLTQTDVLCNDFTKDNFDTWWKLNKQFEKAIKERP